MFVRSNLFQRPPHDQRGPISSVCERGIFPISIEAVLNSTDNMEAVYNHTLLLLKLGKTEEGAYNWLTFRGMDTDKLHQGHIKEKLTEPR